MIQRALEAAAAFETPGRPLRGSVLGVGSGHIHRSFLVECERSRVVLQRLNQEVFPDLDAVMANFSAVTQHLRMGGSPSHDLDRRVLRALPAREGGLLHRASDGSTWRCTRFIQGSRMPTEPTTLEDAKASAFSLGCFLAKMSNFPVASLRIVIPGFHDSLARFAAFQDALAVDPFGRAGGAKAALSFALDQQSLAAALTTLPLPIRAVHNDTKLANVLLDANTGEGLCVLDLDTVMPGLAAYDFGDLLRSAAFDGTEDDATVSLDLDRLKGLTEGYLKGAGETLSKAEIASFPLGAQVIAFELGLRFLTDHLRGDVTFGALYSDQNLTRAQSQFARVSALQKNAACVESLFNPK